MSCYHCGAPSRPRGYLCARCLLAINESRRAERVAQRAVAGVKHRRRVSRPPITKAQARQRTAYMLKTGVMQRKPCESCGDPKVEVHHEDYSDPSKVRFLCRHCHLGVHAKLAGRIPEG